jgi:hypothetical protein
MTVGKISGNRRPLTSETIRNSLGAALLKAKNRHCANAGDLAERLGKHDRKSAESYIMGTTEIGAEALIKGMADPEFGHILADAVADLLGLSIGPALIEAGNCQPDHILPIADVLARVVQMVHPTSDGGAVATDKELLANGEAIDDAGLAIDEIRVALSAARSRARKTPLRGVA